MSFMIAAVLFALGAILASFVGVLVARLSTGESVVSGRSRCDACNRVLPASALVPILSYAASGGRAQCCGARLSPLSTVFEGTLGGLFVLSYGALGSSPTLLFFLAALCMLLALVEYDLLHQVLPPSLLIAFAVFAALTAYAAGGWGALLVRAEIGAAFAAFFALLHFLSGGKWMGLADAPLVFALSLLTGSAAVPGFIFSFWIGAVVGIALLLARPRGSRMGVEVPLAPFLAAGFLLAFYSSWNPFALTLLAPFAL